MGPGACPEDILGGVGIEPDGPGFYVPSKYPGYL